jgi:hypothetical protein
MMQRLGRIVGVLWALGCILATQLEAQTPEDSVDIGSAVLEQALVDAKRQGESVVRLSIPRAFMLPARRGTADGYRFLVLAASGSGATVSDVVAECPWSLPQLRGSVAIGAEILSVSPDAASVRVSLHCTSTLGGSRRPFLWLFRHGLIRDGDGWRVETVEEIGIS